MLRFEVFGIVVRLGYAVTKLPPGWRLIPTTLKTAATASDGMVEPLTVRPTTATRMVCEFTRVKPLAPNSGRVSANRSDGATGSKTLSGVAAPTEPPSIDAAAVPMAAPAVPASRVRRPNRGATTEGPVADSAENPVAIPAP